MLVIVCVLIELCELFVIDEFSKGLVLVIVLNFIEVLWFVKVMVGMIVLFVE